MEGWSVPEVLGEQTGPETRMPGEEDRLIGKGAVSQSATGATQTTMPQALVQGWMGEAISAVAPSKAMVCWALQIRL